MKKINLFILSFVFLIVSVAQVSAEEKEQPKYAPGQLIVKLKEGKTLTDIQELNKKYKVSLTEKVFKDIPNPEDVLKGLKDKLSKLGIEHDKWYWQIDKESKEYKEYLEKTAKEKEQLQKQIQLQEERIADLEKRKKRAQEGITPPNLSSIYLLKTDSKTNVPTMVDDYKANPCVDYAEPNYIATLHMLPNDPYYSSRGSWGQDYDDLWGLKLIQADKAWDISQGEGVVVAVVDSGVDYTHEDLTEDTNANGILDEGEDKNNNGKLDSNIWVNEGEIPDNGIDDDGNGYEDDYRGFDFANSYDLNGDGDYDDTGETNDSDPIDGHGHGTHVAGTIAAIGNNNIGIIGVAPKAKIMALKGLDDDGYGDVTDLGRAIRYAADNGAKVINNSWGTPQSSTIDEAVNYAYTENCVIVVSAGNANTETIDTSPQANPNVILVAAVNQNDQKTGFSNYGLLITVAAPGGDPRDFYPLNAYSNILSLRANGTDMYGVATHVVGTNYYRSSGTSMASPYVAGLAALMRSKYPYYSKDDVKLAIMASADDLGESGVDKYYGYGRINAYKALSASKAPFIKPQDTQLAEQVGDNDRIPESNEEIKLIVTIKNLWKDVSSVTGTLTTGSPYISRILNPNSNFGSLVQNENKDNSTNPFIFKIGAISYDTPVDFTLRTNADGLMQTFKIRVYLGIRKITAIGSPGISGSKIVGCDYRNGNGDISIFDLDTNQETRITTDPANALYPRISGNKIVWQDNRNPYWMPISDDIDLDVNTDIYLFDLDTSKEIRITTDTSEQQVPDISGNKIVWQDWRNGNADIYLFDLSSGQERRITTDPNNHYSPRISGNKIVWYDYRNGNADIYLFDLDANQERRITTDAFAQRIPAISGNKIVWEDWRNGFAADIYLFDLNTNQETRVTNQTSVELNETFDPAISSNNIVWRGHYRNDDTDINGNNDIYLFDLTTNKQTRITIDPSGQYFPSISGNKIVWLDARNGGADIYLAEIPDTAPPVIVHTPVTAISRHPFSVSAKVTDSDSGVKRVELRSYQWPVSGWFLRRLPVLSPMQDKGNNIYTATIPLRISGRSGYIRYQIIAYDKAGNRASTKLYEVKVR